MQTRRPEKLHAGTRTNGGKIQTRRSGRPARLENYRKITRRRSPAEVRSKKLPGQYRKITQKIQTTHDEQSRALENYRKNTRNLFVHKHRRISAVRIIQKLQENYQEHTKHKGRPSAAPTKGGGRLRRPTPFVKCFSFS